MKGKRMDWPALVLAGILVALGAIAAWGWVRRREAIDVDTQPSRTAEPVAIPVVAEEGPATQVAEGGPPTPAPVAAATPATSVGAAAPAQVAASTRSAQASSAAPAAVVQAATIPGPPDPGRIVRGDDAARPFGPASAAPGADGSGPDGWSVKGNADSGLYHTPSSPSWKRMKAEAWFESEEAAEAAGFRRWDWRRAGS